MKEFQQQEDNFGQLRLPWEDETYSELRRGKTQEFKRMLTSRALVDFSNCNLRGVDLRGVNIRKVRLKGAYMKGADLRGLDLSRHDLEGASLHGARISGVLFPSNISPAEIMMSLQTGTRLRVEQEVVIGLGKD
jgi:uncharacterized protein YjbI with pentapeptide repeats